MKRLFDVIAATLGLVVLMPLWVVIAALIKLQDGGSVFYGARRVGQHGRIFKLMKFRTMVLNADKIGAAITTQNDPRVTRIGRFLRKTKLDELPQLFNVLKGDMSLVGPRPEDPVYVAFYNDEQKEILRVKPGITSAASLTYRHEEQLLSGPDWELVYKNQVMPAKLKIDLDYLTHRTFFTDLDLIFRTIKSMLQ
jgi:lipopolysaccharide/colanic/teichoic acid biosynthesis glycosyltransferase